jgi:hypothetical protein
MNKFGNCLPRLIDLSLVFTASGFSKSYRVRCAYRNYLCVIEKWYAMRTLQPYRICPEPNVYLEVFAPPPSSSQYGLPLMYV